VVLTTWFSIACTVHGAPSVGLRRGVALNCASGAVIDSFISEALKSVGYAGHAVEWSRPVQDRQQLCEGSGRKRHGRRGGSADRELVPSDIEVRHNHFFKPAPLEDRHPSYAGTPWQGKNLFELKNARRVLIDGNVFEHNWPQAQNGFAICSRCEIRMGRAVVGYRRRDVHEQHR